VSKDITELYNIFLSGGRLIVHIRGKCIDYNPKHHDYQQLFEESDWRGDQLLLKYGVWRKR
jgi:hypothetical protein